MFRTETLEMIDTTDISGSINSIPTRRTKVRTIKSLQRRKQPSLKKPSDFIPPIIKYSEHPTYELLYQKLFE